MGRSGFALALLFVFGNNVSHAARPERRDMVVKAARNALNKDEVTQDATAWSHINNEEVLAVDRAAQSDELSGRLTTFKNSLVDETVALDGEIEGGSRREEDWHVAKVNVSGEAEISPCWGMKGLGCADGYSCCGKGCIPPGSTCCRGIGNTVFSCSRGNICSGNHCVVEGRPPRDPQLALHPNTCSDLLSSDSFRRAFGTVGKAIQCLNRCEAVCPIIRDALESTPLRLSTSIMCSRKDDLGCLYNHRSFPRLRNECEFARAPLRLPRDRAGFDLFCR